MDTTKATFVVELLESRHAADVSIEAPQPQHYYSVYTTSFNGATVPFAFEDVMRDCNDALIDYACIRFANLMVQHEAKVAGQTSNCYRCT